MALGVMEATLADRLMQGAPADFESAAELSRAHQFALDTLLSVRPHLPPLVRTVLEGLGPNPPRWSASKNARALLWHSIKTDSMGDTPGGAATRAALFVFPDDESAANASDVIWYFCMFYCRAGLPEHALVTEFHRHWPPSTPNNSLERTREK